MQGSALVEAPVRSDAGRTLHAFAFVSGAAALVYEVAWTKLLSLTFGSSTLAVSASVAGFMGGMGVGAWLYHRAARSGRNALRTYAWLELGIALAAVVLTLWLEQLPAQMALLFRALAQSDAQAMSGGLATALRLGSVLALVLGPTALMGATYPALCAVAIGSRDALDRHLGALYGWNTVGAAFGGLVAGIALIPAVGLRHGIAVGVALNVAVGLAAFALSRSHAGSDPPVGEEADAIASSLPPFACALALFVSGFATLAYEIVWFRVFRAIGGNSTYAFTIVLVTFLVGLGVGALALRPALRRAAPEVLLAVVQLGIASAASIAMLLAALLLAGVLGLDVTFEMREVRELAWPLRLALHGGVALVLMLPATLLMGLSFPLASRMFVGSAGLARVGERVGTAVLLANAGSIAGSILAATWLLPTLGSMQSSRAIAATNVALGLLVAHFAPGSRAQRLRWTAPLALGALAFTASVPERIPYQRSALGGLPARVVFEEEGDLATVRVSEAIENPRLRGMSIDNVTIGASAGWSYPIYSKQVLIAHLPMWLEPRIRSALQIGLGSASTLDALARHGELERIECVEISAAVVRGSRYFEESRALADPRVRVAVEDAVHYLLRTPQRYDLIVADGKQSDDFGGTAKMMSAELYALALDRLSAHGLFVQWVPIGNGVDEFRTIVRTLASVFPELAVFYDPPTSAIFVAGREPLSGRARMPVATARARMREDLGRLGFADPLDLRFEWLADRAALAEAVGPGPLSTWDHSRIEFASYRADRREQGPLGFAAASNLDWLLEAGARAAARAPSDLVPSEPAVARAHAHVRRAYVELLRADRATALAQLELARAQAPDDAIVARAQRRIAQPLEGR